MPIPLNGCLPTCEELCRWHARLYAECEVPVAGYVGHFRGDPVVPELIDYEVGLGARLKDGNLEKMGVWARLVSKEMGAVLAGLNAVFAELDARLPVGKSPTTPDDIVAVISFTALAAWRVLTSSPLCQRQRTHRQVARRVHLSALWTADVSVHQASARE